MKLELSAITHLYYPGDMPNNYNWSTMSDKMWHISISIRFCKTREFAITHFRVDPPICTPKKLYKELCFKSASYKELCKYLKKNKDKIGDFNLLW